MIVEQHNKLNQLVHFLRKHKNTKIIVYFLTCACVDFYLKVSLTIKHLHKKVLTELPYTQKLRVFGLHGQMVQNRREKVYKEFVESSSGVLICTDVAARGLDIEGVEYIIQFDPPVDPSVFIHRVGRTARMGKSGVAIVYLTPQEDEYVEFLKVKSVPIQQMPIEENVKDVLPKLMKLELKDRDIMEKGMNAFVSFVRAYKEHHCNYIFKFDKLDFESLAKAYVLLKV